MLPLLASLALGAPRATLDAEVGPDLDYVRGTLTVEASGVTVVDPLAALPMPTDDRTAMRTFPGLEEQGSVVWTQVGPGKWQFHAWLPRRFGGVGATRHGLFANGAWYPQPVVDGDPLPELDWEVRVRGPDEVVMALGTSVGGAEVRWAGVAERASLAVVPHGVVERIPGTGVYALARRRVPRRWFRELQALVQDGTPDPHEARGVLVRAPLRRRLARPGVGQALVSDRAYRVFPGLQRFHRVGIAREVLPALVPVADPVAREWVGASWAEDYADGLKGAGVPELSAWARWIPSIDFLLTSKTMPFYGEVVERRYLEDPLHDDLAEIYAPHYPGPAVVQMLTDLGGPETPRAMAAVLAQGAPIDEAIPPEEPAAALVRGWTAPVPDQDYRLTVEADRAVVVREAPADAPAEWVRLRIDDEVVPWLAGPGPDQFAHDGRPERFVIDPGAHLLQRSRVGDAWPTRFRFTGGGWIDSVNLTDLRAVAAVSGSVRRAGDLRNAFGGTLATNDQDLARARVTFAHRFGVPLDGVRRAHRLALSMTAGVHHPWYRDDTGNRYSVGAGLAWSYSTRVASYFPVRGQNISLGTSLGYAPDTNESWAGFGSGFGTLISWHPRWALDVGVSLGGAVGTGENRKRELGGLGGVRGLDPAVNPAGAIRSVQSVELRWAPIRQASVPLGFGWANELQLGAGVEVGEIVDDGKLTPGVGLIAGVFGMAEMLGLEPRGMGLTVGWPLVDGSGPVPLREGSPRLYIRWGPNL